MRLAPALLPPALLALTLAACNASGDARRAGQVRYEGRTLEEWWQQRRDADDATAAQARTAMRMLGPAAVPFLADKAASHELGETIGGSVALEDQCPSALPAMEAARAKHPSPALDAAIQRVKARATDRTRAGLCAANGEPVRPEAQQR